MFRGLFDFRNQKLILRWEILSSVFFFFIISLLILYNQSDNTQFVTSSFYKQILWFCIGFFVFIIVQFIKVQYLYDYSYFLYLLLFALLLSTILSPERGGAQSWIILGPFSFQPSEVGKIIYTVFLARFFTDFAEKKDLSWYFLFMLILLLLPAIIVAKQPDLGTAMIYLSIIMPMLFWSGFSRGLILLLIFPVVSLVAVSNLMLFYIWMIICIVILFYVRDSLLTSFTNIGLNLISGIASPYIFWNVLNNEQRERILTTINPYLSPLKDGYQVIQSMISIGSGGALGKGLGQGTQTHLRFLPVRDTDFIISVISEEMGFIAILFILVALIWFIYWCFEYAVKIENKFASLLLVGSCTIIFMHFIINMGMVAGLLPVTGLPVPFISYGGTFFLTCSILLGLINNIINNYI